MIDPSAWASVPYGNKTALLDFFGTYDLWHKALAQQIFLTLGVNYRTYPLGDGGGPEWLHAVQAQNVNVAAALGLAPPPDLSTFDLSQPEDHASFFFAISQQSKLLRTAAGLP